MATTVEKKRSRLKSNRTANKVLPNCRSENGLFSIFNSKARRTEDKDLEIVESSTPHESTEKNLQSDSEQKTVSEGSVKTQTCTNCTSLKVCDVHLPNKVFAIFNSPKNNIAADPALVKNTEPVISDSERSNPDLILPKHTENDLELTSVEAGEESNDDKTITDRVITVKNVDNLSDREKPQTEDTDSVKDNPLSSKERIMSLKTNEPQSKVFPIFYSPKSNNLGKDGEIEKKLEPLTEKLKLMKQKSDSQSGAKKTNKLSKRSRKLRNNGNDVSESDKTVKYESVEQKPLIESTKASTLSVNNNVDDDVQYRLNSPVMQCNNQIESDSVETAKQGRGSPKKVPEKRGRGRHKKIIETEEEISLENSIDSKVTDIKITETQKRGRGRSKIEIQTEESELSTEIVPLQNSLDSETSNVELIETPKRVSPKKEILTEEDINTASVSLENNIDSKTSVIDLIQTKKRGRGRPKKLRVIETEEINAASVPLENYNDLEVIDIKLTGSKSCEKANQDNVNVEIDKSMETPKQLTKNQTEKRGRGRPKKLRVIETEEINAANVPLENSNDLEVIDIELTGSKSCEKANQDNVNVEIDKSMETPSRTLRLKRTCTLMRKTTETENKANNKVQTTNSKMDASPLLGKREKRLSNSRSVSNNVIRKYVNKKKARSPKVIKNIEESSNEEVLAPRTKRRVQNILSSETENENEEEVHKPPKKKKRNFSRIKEQAQIVLDKSDDDDLVIIENKSTDFTPTAHKLTKAKHKVEAVLKYTSIFEENSIIPTEIPNHVHGLDRQTNDERVASVGFKLKVDEDVVGFHDNQSKFEGFTDCDVKSKANININIEKSFSKSANISPSLEMWTNKYKPNCSADMISQDPSLSTLSAWLLEWKTRKNAVAVDESSCSSCGSNINDDIIRCVLLTGDTGAGKTSTVYALAEEHKFKVIEVNSSSLRSGKLITTQLQEATQSHHVEGSSALHKFFTKNAERANATIIKKEDTSVTISGSKLSEKKTKRDKLEEKKAKTGIMAFFKKKPDELNVVLENDEVKTTEAASKPQNKTIQQFFKVATKPIPTSAPPGPTSKEDANEKSQVTLESTPGPTFKEDANEKSQVTSESTPVLNEIEESVEIIDVEDELTVVQEICKKQKNCESELQTTDKCDSETVNINEDNEDDASAHGLKFSSASIILFDDVDVVFEEDEAFWSSVNSFIRSTKKPVILTAGKSLISVRGSIRDAEFQELRLESRPKDVRRYLKKICDQENLALTAEDARHFLNYCNFDCRQLLLQLQFWTRTELSGDIHSTLPIILFCLDHSRRKKFCTLMHSGPLITALRILEQFSAENFHPLYANLHNWFPCLIRDGVKNSMTEEKCSEQREISTEVQKQSEDSEYVPQVKTNVSTNDLRPVTELLNNFSLCNTFGFDQKQPLYCKIPAVDDTYNTALGLEISTAIELLSVRKCYNQMQSNRLTNSPAEDQQNLKLYWHDKYNNTVLQGIRNITDEITTSGIPMSNEVRVDYLGALQLIRKAEIFRRDINSTRTRRFLHYFDSMGLNVDLAQLTRLSKSFE